MHSWTGWIIIAGSRWNFSKDNVSYIACMQWNCTIPLIISMITSYHKRFTEAACDSVRVKVPQCCSITCDNSLATALTCTKESSVEWSALVPQKNLPPFVESFQCLMPVWFLHACTNTHYSLISSEPGNSWELPLYTPTHTVLWP